MKLDIGEDWLRRMAALEDGCEISVGGDFYRALSRADPNMICATSSRGGGYDVLYHEGGTSKTRHFGSRSRAKRFAGHIARCRK